MVQVDEVRRLATMILQTPPVICGRRVGKTLFFAEKIAEHLLRQGVILLPCIWLLPCFLQDHALAIWLALPISDVLCQLATVLPLVLHSRFLSRVRLREEIAARPSSPRFVV